MDVYESVDRPLNSVKSFASWRRAKDLGVFGWPEHSTTVNSLAPFGNLTMSSTSVAEALHVVPLSSIQDEMVRELDSPFGEHSLEPIGFSQISPRVEMMEFDIVARQAFREAATFAQGRLPEQLDWRAVVVRSSRPDLAPEVEAYAQSTETSDALAVIGELCMRFVPEARRVLVTLTLDPEDGTTGFHFCVETIARVEAVVDAEDRLHEALFERIPSARRPVFSIGYTFIH